MTSGTVSIGRFYKYVVGSLATLTKAATSCGSQSVSRQISQLYRFVARFLPDYGNMAFA